MTPPDPLPVNDPNPKRNFQAEEKQLYVLELEKRLVEIENIMHASGIPTGNEHKAYSLVEQVQYLSTVKKYWQEQTDSLRPKLAASEAKLEAGKALHKDIKNLLDKDTLDYGVCSCGFCVGIKSALAAYEKATQEEGK